MPMSQDAANCISGNVIPGDVHLIWYGIDFESPEEVDAYRPCIESIRKNSKCAVKIWNKQECESLLEEPCYQKYASIYARATAIMKFDIARNIVVHKNGGFYLDCDVLVLEPFSELRAEKEVFFVETYLTEEFSKRTALVPIRRGIPEDRERIANYAFGSVPQNDIFLKILDEIEARMNMDPQPANQYDIIFLTGPDVFTTVIHKNLPRNILPQPRASRYIRHLHAGLWRKDYASA